MKSYIKFLLVYLFAAVFVTLAHAQATGTPVTASFTANDVVALLTPVVVPLIIAGMKLLMPKIPSWILPLIAPVLGVLINIIDQAVTSHAGNIWLAAALGLAGVGVREVVDQTKQTVTAPPATP